MRAFRRAHSGAMLLISILAVGGVGLALVLGSAVRLIGELHAGEGDVASRQALAAAESCVYESLLRLVRDSSFGGATLTVGEASCTSVVTSEGGAQRSIVATGMRGRWTRSLIVRVDIGTPKLTILEWSEW